jgi:ribosomal protein L16 Arg81 hydroxylase
MVLDEVLQPIGVDSFFKNYWNRKPLLIKGARQKFEMLPGVVELPRLAGGLVDGRTWEEGENSYCNAYRVAQDGEAEQVNNVPADVRARMFNAGYTLCFGDVSFADSVLSELVYSATNLCAFRAATLVTCYLSPPNSRGIVHYDAQHVFFIQRSGAKHWRISERPGKVHPISNFVFSSASADMLEAMTTAGYAIKSPIECGFVDFRLGEGDLLYLPPGYYHLPHTTDDHSFHYTLTLGPVAFRDFFLEAVNGLLWKNSEYLNEDIRAMDDAERLKALAERLEFVKEQVRSLSAEELERKLRER